MAGKLVDKVKASLKKYCWVVGLILLAYSIYQTVVDDVKIVEKEVIVTVVDEELKSKYDEQVIYIGELKRKINKAVKKNVEYTETIREITHADGTSERITERTNRDTSTSDSSSESTHVAKSTTTKTGDSETIRHGETTTDAIHTKESTARFWSTIAGYQVKQKEIILGQGINLFKNLNMGVIGSMKAIDERNRFDYGVVLIMRY